ncbi:MAG: rhomboid family intramembrane serine protease [Haloarculaceae archaeon]
MAAPIESITVALLSRLGLILALAFAVVVLARADVLSGWRRTLTARFVAGVPWGTAIVVGWLLFVYFVVQGAWAHPYDPLVVPFRSWSYLYPEGMFFAPFAHDGRGHLVGNIVSTLAFAPIVEFAWGHYARSEASVDQPWLGRPAGRIAAFVGAVFVMGLLTSLFVPGPLIGFSGVVFAFAGAGLVVAPLQTVVAILASNVFSLFYRAWIDPVRIAEAQQRFIVPPWADVAIHGHALGLLVGIAGGIWLLRRTGDTADLAHVWIAGLVFGVAETLWAFFWSVGSGRFALFRGVGLAAVVFFASVVVVAVGGSERRVLPPGLLERPGPLRGLAGLSRRRAAFVLLVGPVLVLAAVAVPFNLVAIDDPDLDDGVEVGSYRVTYAEDVPDRIVPDISLPFVDGDFRIERSGVIVVNDRRHIWEAVIKTGGLAFRGTGRVTVGGLGWRETVYVNRTTWTVVDGGATYTVYVRRPGEPRKQVYIDDPVVVPAVLDGKRVTIRPTAEGYRLAVSENETTLAQGPMPGPGENVTLANLRFAREGASLVASFERTRIHVANLKLKDRED